jgi:hypothetical protein
MLKPCVELYRKHRQAHYRRSADGTLIMFKRVLDFDLGYASQTAAWPWR